jgi:putative transcriptional regulator
MLLVATPREPSGATFSEAVILLIDAEPNGIVTGICLNRRLEIRVLDTSALALLFVPEPDARAFWGGPMGSDPAVLAQFSDVNGLEWFHLPIQQHRPFPLPDVGVIAVAEHTTPFEERIVRARLFIGLCVWGRGQLEDELSRDEWLVRSASADDVFTAEPERLWARLRAQ